MKPMQYGQWICIFVLILVLGILYWTENLLVADSKDIQRTGTFRWSNTGLVRHSTRVHRSYLAPKHRTNDPEFLGEFGDLVEEMSQNHEVCRKEEIIERYRLFKDLGDYVYPMLLWSGSFWKKSPAQRQEILREGATCPWARFIFREDVLRSLEAYPGESISRQEIMALIQKPTQGALSDFQSLGTWDGPLGTFNNLFYGAYGLESFRTGGAQYRGTNDATLMRALGEEIYAHLSALKPGENFVFHVWGFGGITEGLSVLARTIQDLDTKNGTDRSNQLRWIVSDVSDQAVAHGQERAAHTDILSDWMNRGILNVRTLDALSPPKELRGTADLIYSSYLYDSLPQRIFTRRGNTLYELLARPVLDTSTQVPLMEGGFISGEHFREILSRRELKELSRLEPAAFNLVKIEHVLRPLSEEEIGQVPFLKDLSNQGEEGEAIHVGEIMLDALIQAQTLLKPRGQIQILDLVNVGKWKRMAYKRDGSFYAPLQTEIFRGFAAYQGMPFQLEHVGEWLEGHYQDRLIWGSVFHDSGLAAQCFPIQKLPRFEQIVSLATQAQQMAGSPDERAKFFWSELRKIFPSTTLAEPREAARVDFLQDLQRSIVENIYFHGLQVVHKHETGWIGQRLYNPRFMSGVKACGFQEDVLDHALSLSEEARSRLNLYRVRLGGEIPVGPAQEDSDQQITDQVSKALSQAQELLGTRPSLLLGRFDSSANLHSKVKVLQKEISYTAEEEQELMRLLDEYFSLERYVHRIKGEYLSQGRMNLLSIARWTIFSSDLLNATFQQLLWQAETGGWGRRIDLLSFAGEGGMGADELNEVYRSFMHASVSLELCESLGQRHNPGFANTGIVVIYPLRLERDFRLIAYDARDKIEFLSLLGWGYPNEQKAMAELLDVAHIRELRKAILMRQGVHPAPDVITRSWGAHSQPGTFEERETLVMDGIPGSMVEAIVVADSNWEMVGRALGERDPRVIRESEYFSANNQRIQRGLALRAQILQIVQQARQRSMGMGQKLEEITRDSTSL